MKIEISDFAKRSSADSGIVRLMRDLDAGLTPGSKQFFLGGGNPAIVGEIVEAVARENEKLLQRPEEYTRTLGIYDHPSGNTLFREQVASYLGKKFASLISKENILITNGSQSSFFLLFHLLAGPMNQGKKFKHILFPMLPEYIGYHDLGMYPDMFRSIRSKVTLSDTNRFLYQIDWEAFENTLHDEAESTGLIALSRPSNPTSRVLEAENLEKISHMAKEASAFFLVDNAYGYPFPNIIHTQAPYEWHENMILTFSLSKLGLPGLRTGLILAAPEIIERLSEMQSIISLSPGGFGPALLGPLFENGKIDSLCAEHLKPYYEQKAALAQEVIDSELKGKTRYYLHEHQGAFFLWLWLPDLTISTEELYEKAREDSVVIVPGFYFQPQRKWQHLEHCIRISIARPDEEIAAGLTLLCKRILSLSEKKTPN